MVVDVVVVVVVVVVVNIFVVVVVPVALIVVVVVVLAVLVVGDGNCTLVEEGCSSSGQQTEMSSSVQTGPLHHLELALYVFRGT